MTSFDDLTSPQNVSRSLVEPGRIESCLDLAEKSYNTDRKDSALDSIDVFVEQYHVKPFQFTSEENEIKTLDFEISHDALEDGAHHVIHTLFPHWDMGRVVFDVCTNGITNKLLKVTYHPEKELLEDQDDNVVLVRTYGKDSDILIDRTQEWENLLLLSSRGLCPRVHGRFKNGIVYGYLEGQVFSVDDMRDTQKSMLVAKHLATWHKVPVSSSSPRLFSTLRKWVSAIPATYSSSTTQSLRETKMPHITKSYLVSLINTLEPVLISTKSPVVFCHNDLLFGNIIYKVQEDRVDFIDYEYGGPSYRGFDIANHFCEFAGFECEWDRYPSKETQQRWLAKYWSAYYSTSATQEDLDALYKEILQFSLAAHLFWSIWAMVQAELSDLDFDYVDYARQRLDEFERRKGEWLHPTL